MPARPTKRKRAGSTTRHNPAVTAAVLEIVEQQLHENKPPEVRQTLERLVRDGHSEAAARRYIGIAVLFAMNDMLANGTDYDDAQYVAILNRLPNLF